MKSFFSKKTAPPAATPAPPQQDAAPQPSDTAIMFGGMNEKRTRRATRTRSANDSPSMSNSGAVGISSHHSNDGTMSETSEATTTTSTAVSSFAFIGGGGGATPVAAGAQGKAAPVLVARRKGKGTGPTTPVTSTPQPSSPSREPDPPLSSVAAIEEHDEHLDTQRRDAHQSKEPSPEQPAVQPSITSSASSGFTFMNAAVAPPAPPAPTTSEELEHEHHESREREELTDQKPADAADVATPSASDDEKQPIDEDSGRSPDDVVDLTPTEQRHADPTTSPTPLSRIAEQPERRSSKSSESGHKVIGAQMATAQRAHDESIRAVQQEARALNQKKVAIIASKAAITTRRGELKLSLRATEDAQMQCVADEKYLEAEALNTKLESLRRTILSDEQKLDAIENDITDLDAKLFELSSKLTRRLDVYSSQLQDIGQSFERSLSNFSSEAQHRFEAAEERIREDMEKAERAVHNAQVDLDNLQQREQKLNDKIAEQTKEVRTELTTRQNDYDNVTEEIADLEAKLEMKRQLQKTLAEQIVDLEAKVGLVRSDFSDNLSRVAHQITQDTQRLHDCQAVIADLERDRAEVFGEKSSADEEAELRKRLINRMMDESRELATAVANQQADIVTRRAQAQSTSLKTFTAQQRSIAESEKAVATMEEDLRALHTEMESRTTRIEMLTRQSSDAARQLPELEAAKKVAVANRAFKDAQAKADQIKKLSDEKERLDSDAAETRAHLQELEAKGKTLTSDIAIQKEAIAVEKDTWATAYVTALRLSRRVAERQLREREILEGSHEALRAHIEWTRVVLESLGADPTESDDGDNHQDDDDDDGARCEKEEPARVAEPIIVDDQTADIDSPKESGSPAPLKNSEFESLFASGPFAATTTTTTPPTAKEEEEPVEHESDDDAAEELEDPQRRPRDEVEAELAALQQRQNDHIEREEFEACAELEDQITALKAELDH
eukprot:PhM_4_TR11388/c1_g1_i1/m.31363